MTSDQHTFKSESTAISAYGYSSIAKAITVHFVSGGVYTFPCDEKTFNEFHSSESKGRAFQKLFNSEKTA